MSSTISLFTMFLIFFILIELVAFGLSRYLKNYKIKDEDLIAVSSKKSENLKKEVYGKYHGVLTRGQIKDFMEFDKIKDGMIIREKGSVFTMVIQGSGVNYDLSSETDQIAIEQGFQQFLNVLKFPIQIYVQTSMVNFRSIIDGYKEKAEIINLDKVEVQKKLQEAKNTGDEKKYDKLMIEYRRKENLYEYVLDAIRTTEEISGNKNVLERKNYIIITFNKSELGLRVNEFSEEEIEEKAYRELINRARNLMEALSSAMVTTKILNSEELIDLLFIAYNRDETSYIDVREHVEAEYDDFYTVSKDVYLKEKELIEKNINQDAMRLVTESLREADKEKRVELLKMRRERAEKIRKKAQERLKEFKGKAIDSETYNAVKEKLSSVEIDVDNNNVKFSFNKKNNEKSENNKNEEEKELIDDFLNTDKDEKRIENKTENQILNKPIIRLNREAGRK